MTPLRASLQTSLGSAYTLGRELGGGGMSRVYVARDGVLGRDVVVKVLAPELAAGVRAERFAREVALAARLQHPHIVPLLSAGTTSDGLPYYTMPFVEGESLRERMQRGDELPLAEVISLLREIARALAYAHGRGVVHRDIKPENVLLASGAAMVSDFGVAKALAAASPDGEDRLTQLGFTLGTPAYMAPEQIAADPQLDHRADLYALGCLAYELLAGQAPFAGRPVPAMLAAHLTELPERIERRRSGLPPALAALISRCLEKVPDNRPSSADEIVRALEALVAPDPARATATADLPVTAASLIVHPLDNLSGDPSQEYFARGLLDDLLIELSRFPTIDPIRSAEVAGADGPVMSPAPVADYALRGSVRRVGDEVLLAVQLEDARTSRQLWADRYATSAERLLDVEDEIVARVAAALAVRVDVDRLVRARRTPPGSLALYDLWLRGIDSLRRGTIAGDDEARTLFERALELDPHYARAHAGLSLASFNEWSCQAWERWDETERRAFDHARRAAELDDADAMVHLVLGRIRLYRREFAEAAHSVERSLALAPSDPDVLAQAAICLAHLGEATRALSLVRRAMRLNPYHPDYYVAIHGVVLFVAGLHAESVEVAERVPHGTVTAPAFLAAGAALAGLPERARAYLAMFLADFEERVTFGRVPEPGEPLRWLLHVTPFRRAEDEARLTRGLRLAGLAADPDEGREPIALDDSVDRSDAVFRRAGDGWILVFDGDVVHLADTKGFHDLATLLARPGEPVHCLELAGRPPDDGDDPVLDTRARRELRDRARELQEEIDDADGAHDLGRAERARAELDRLVDAASRALGRRGESRRLGSATERARSAVTWRIRSAIRKVGAAHESLGRHLEHSVRTGTYCEYAPEHPVSWTV